VAVSLLKGRVLIAGVAQGPVLRLDAPLSFWGGVDPARGVVSDPRHPDHGRSIAGTVLALARPVGSSSSSAVLLEAIRVGKAPAALLLGEVDAILALAVIVAREMGYATLPVLHLAEADMAKLVDGQTIAVGEDGAIASPG
jgi:predicted aconitase with swiveling domain